MFQWILAAVPFQVSGAPMDLWRNMEGPPARISGARVSAALVTISPKASASMATAMSSFADTAQARWTLAAACEPIMADLMGFLGRPPEAPGAISGPK